MSDVQRSNPNISERRRAQVRADNRVYRQRHFEAIKFAKKLGVGIAQAREIIRQMDGEKKG